MHINHYICTIFIDNSHYYLENTVKLTQNIAFVNILYKKEKKHVFILECYRSL